MVAAGVRRVLVTGALGQIGTELTRELRRRLGERNVVASSRRTVPAGSEREAGPFVVLDVTEREVLEQTVRENRIDTIYHLAAILSAVAEGDPERAWHVNVDGLGNVLETARRCGVEQVFWPSSIAAFGPGSPLEHTPQDTVMRPSTIYGVSKVTGELLCDYYHRRYGLDVRGVRYPGVISSGAPPGGGTTDYAVEMFQAAVAGRPYTSFVSAATVLPMIYMPDCIKAALDLMEADLAQLTHHNAFNLAAMSFSAAELAAAIRAHAPDFHCDYDPDYRQAIADSWPRSIDDAAARREWGWSPAYDLPAMTRDMLARLGAARRTS